MNKDIAKELFCKYKGMLFFMSRGREGEYERYASFHISKEQELEWLLEMQADFLAKMNCAQNADLQIQCLGDYVDVSISTQLKDWCAFQLMLEYVRQHISTWDTKTLLTSINIIFSNVQSFYNPRRFSYDAQETAKEILTAMIGILNDAMNCVASPSDKQDISGNIKGLNDYIAINIPLQKQSDVMDANTPKDLFRKYNGSLFFMMNGERGDDKKYHAFNISKAQEHEWLLDMQSEFLEKLNSSQSTALQIRYLRDYAEVSFWTDLRDMHAFQVMLEYVQRQIPIWDSKTLLINLNVIFTNIQMFSHSANASYTDKKVRDEAFSTIIMILNDAKKFAASPADQERINNAIDNYKDFLQNF